jgi:hypothetical protein
MTKEEVLSEFDIEYLWEYHSAHVGDDIDSLQQIAGTSIMTKKDFIDACEEILQKIRAAK